MVNEIYNLYKETLPDIIRSRDTIKTILGDKSNHVIIRKDKNRLAGVSVINGNTIYLLCVAEDFQKQGIGSELLMESEEYISSRGFNKIILGNGDDYIMPGVPMNKNAHEFFKKHGYAHSWGDSGCYDMWQELENFNYTKFSIGDIINGVLYRKADINDLNRILISLSDNEEDFTEYYRNEELYKGDDKILVLLAEINGEVLGTLFVGIETECEGFGNIGLTATARKYRGKGVATNLVRIGTKYLKEKGLEKAHLSFTYTGLLNLYRRAGYEVCMEYFMGEKELPQ